MIIIGVDYHPSFQTIANFVEETSRENNEVTGPVTTFGEQADWWLKEIRAGPHSQQEKADPMKSATIAGYESAVIWLTNIIGDKPLAEVKNDAARELVTAMKAAKPPLADKTIVSYFQVMKARRRVSG